MPDLPVPPVPADCDLRHLTYIPLHIDRLTRSKSWLLARRKPELAFYMLNLWIASWHEVPAASLEDDDEVLSHLARCDIRRFSRIKGDLLRGWTKCSDGRLYHHVVAELAIEALKTRKSLSSRGSQGAAKRWHGNGTAMAEPMADDAKELKELNNTPLTPQGGLSRKRRDEGVDPRLPAEEPWQQRLDCWVKGRRWLDKDGPEPGQRGCVAPPDLVKTAIKRRAERLNGAAA